MIVRKKHYRSKSSESCFAGILQNSFPNSLFEELVSKHYGLDRKFSRNSMAKPSIRRFCNVQPSDRAGSTRHSGNRADRADSTPGIPATDLTEPAAPGIPATGHANPPSIPTIDNTLSPTSRQGFRSKP